MSFEYGVFDLRKISNADFDDFAISNAKYNYLIDFINFSSPQIVTEANKKLPHECKEVRPSCNGMAGWYLGSKDYNCYKTSYYLLPDEKIAGLHYFIDNQNPIVDLSPAVNDGSITKKDYDDIRLLSSCVFLLGFRVGLADKMTDWLMCTETPF